MRLGCDPEVLLQDETLKPISVIGFINAGKEYPHQIPDMPEGFTLQEDNVSLEYGIPPASSADEFQASIMAVLERSRSYIPPNVNFSRSSCLIFPKDQMDHPGAHEFGCEPDFNAWTMEMNKFPELPHPFMRSAGGHVHVETNLDPVMCVKALDLCLSVPAVLMDDGFERKKIYGKAGAYRRKSYGVEYRSLSNFWIFEPELIRWVWRNTERGLSMGDVSNEQDRILEAINNNNVDVAKSLINDYNLEVLV